ncbi:29364_t:CDS:2 [Gigaspora margarita]|uniref:29364_t:CDS:1 n=1 Tax=Gigaspora margarita TaxID=4874 RepID=A0ABN7UVI3_GIGMA|nr:29364_t:CDS:2 [Gigaspora margarita]
MATTTRAKYHQLEKQQSILLTDDDDNRLSEGRLSKDNSLDYISDNNNIFANDYNDDENNNEDSFQDIYNTLNTSKKKKNPRTSTKPKSSFAWKFFSQPIDGKVHCQVANCNAVLGYYNTQSTMKSYLHNKHQITKALLNKKSVDELKKSLKPENQLTLQQSLEIIKPHTKIQTQKLNNNLLRFIINSIKPLSIVEDKDFIKYSHDLDPKYKLPCKPVLKDKIDEVYHNNINEIQQKIDEINYTSMTLDLWSSAAHISYLGVILHWKVINEVVQLLEPFEQLTKLFSGQYYSILNLIYPCIVYLQNSLSKESTNFNTSEVIKIRKIIKEDLALCWDYPNDIGIYASFFDLRFKNLDFLTQSIDDLLLLEIDWFVRAQAQMHFAKKRLYFIYNEKTSIVPISTNSILLIEPTVKLAKSKDTFDKFKYENKALEEAKGYFTKETLEDEPFENP